MVPEVDDFEEWRRGGDGERLRPRGDPLLLLLLLLRGDAGDRDFLAEFLVVLRLLRRQVTGGETDVRMAVLDACFVLTPTLALDALATGCGAGDVGFLTLVFGGDLCLVFCLVLAIFGFLGGACLVWPAAALFCALVVVVVFALALLTAVMLVRNA